MFESLSMCLSQSKQEKLFREVKSEFWWLLEDVTRCVTNDSSLIQWNYSQTPKNTSFHQVDIKRPYQQTFSSSSYRNLRIQAVCFEVHHVYRIASSVGPSGLFAVGVLCVLCLGLGQTVLASCWLEFVSVSWKCDIANTWSCELQVSRIPRTELCSGRSTQTGVLRTSREPSGATLDTVDLDKDDFRKLLEIGSL